MRRDRVYQDDPIDKAARLGRRVTIRCWSCRHAVERDAAWLADLATARGWPRMITALCRRFACSACGKRNPHIEVENGPTS